MQLALAAMYPGWQILPAEGRRCFRKMIEVIGYLITTYGL